MNPRSMSAKMCLLLAMAMACGMLGACERQTAVYSYDPKVDSVAPPQLALNTASYLEDQKTRLRPSISEPAKPTTPASAPAAAGGAAPTPEPAAAGTPAGGAEAGPTTAPAVPAAPKTPPPPIPE